jgi:hypothetical protein
VSLEWLDEFKQSRINHEVVINKDKGNDDECASMVASHPHTKNMYNAQY